MQYPANVSSTIQTNSSINRFSEKREQTAQIKSFFLDHQSKFILMYKGQFITNKQKLQPSTLTELSNVKSIEVLLASIIRDKIENKLPKELIYLGHHLINQKNLEHLFVIPIDPEIDIDPELELGDARSLSFSANKVMLEIILYTQGIISWHFNHPFCAKCGCETDISHSGHARLCQSKNCNKLHFPRIEPAVIFSIIQQSKSSKTDNRILLARQSSWPEKRYSVLAGFAEHGETLEQSVKREAYEEVGLNVSHIKYFGSQPWPFPASLMIAFTSETSDDTIRLIDKELECAKWFTASEIKEQIQSGELLAPYSISISWQILENWYKNQTGHSLESIKKANE